jgi:TolB-like protein/DNA-binding winged helix-turn-helix (wHTH) protein
MTESTDLPPSDDPPGPPRLARFGSFELDLRSGELRRAGVRVKLQEQPLKLLLFLLEHPGEVVTREELRERLWPAEFVDFDHSLNTAVRKLRAALDDVADNPRFVETLARRGYRFIAPVSLTGGPAPTGAVLQTTASAIDPATPGQFGGRKGRKVLGALLALLVLVVVSTLVWSRARITPLREKSAVPTRGPIASIAVLPFGNQEASTDHLADGVTEILIDRLSRLPDLRVMARSTVFEYKGKRVHPSSVGEELDVQAVVTGNVRRAADQTVIHVELIDVRDGAQIWGRRYESSSTDLPLTQARIADDLGLHLRSGVRTAAPKAASAGLTRNADAYEHYLRGLHLWNERGDANVRASLDHFGKAIQLDPGFAAAYAGQSNAYGVLTGKGLLTPEQGTLRVMASARKALELDPDSAEAYTSIATTAFRNLWDFAGAERDYRRAIALNPNYSTAHQWYADFLRSMGRWDEAWREMEMARRIDPLSKAVNSSMCGAFAAQRRYDEAVAFAEKLQQLGRPLPFCRSVTLFYRGDYEGLAAHMEKNPEAPAAREQAEGFRKGGGRGLLEARLRCFQQQPNPEASFAVDIAEAYVLLGRHDDAFAWLEKGFDHRVTGMTSFYFMPTFDAVREDPRFANLVRRIGIPAAGLESARSR